MLPYLLLLYHNTTQKISLTGPTNYENKLTVDYFQTIIIPLLKKINVTTNIEITKRGYGEEPGKIILYTKESNKLKPFSMLEKGELDHSTIYVHSYGHNENVNEYIIEGLKNTLTPKNILINDYKSTFVENREKHKGYGADAVLIYDNTVLGANVSSTKKQPSQLGKELADKIISLITRDTPLDTHATNMIVPFLAYYELNGKIIYPKKDEYMDDCLYVCETILGTKYKKEEREKDIYLELNP
jgi:RNA 3'-terminal phosphate cyclase